MYTGAITTLCRIAVSINHKGVRILENMLGNCFLKGGVEDVTIILECLFPHETVSITLPFQSDSSFSHMLNEITQRIFGSASGRWPQMAPDASVQNLFTDISQ